MGGDSLDDSARGKGQSRRLERQHQLAGGPLGIFGDEAKKHDLSIREVMNVIVEALQASYPGLSFRHRPDVSKRAINDKLASIDPNLGQVLFIQTAADMARILWEIALTSLDVLSEDLYA